MFKKKNILSLIVLFLCCPVAWGQTPTELPTPTITIDTPTPSVSPVPNTPIATPVSWPNQILGLQYELHETTYQINATPTNKMALILAGEDLLNDACVDISKNRNFEKTSPTSKCSVLTDRILSLDPQNPAAICAKTGTSSTFCRNAYEQVGVSMVRVDSIALKDKDVSGYIATQYSDSTQKIIRDLGSLTSDYYRKKTSDLEKKIISGYATALQQECTTVAYEIDFTESMTPTPTISISDKPFEGLMKELSQPKNLSNQPNSKPSHRRLISVTCLDLLDRLKHVFPDSYPLICTMKTYFSPQCHQSIAAFKKSASSIGKQESTTSHGDGIGKF